MFKVFDVHTHTYPEAIAEKACVNLGKFYGLPISGKGTYADLEAQAAENNVGGYLLFSVATNAHQVEKVNSSIADLVHLSRSHGFRTYGFAGMHQDFPNFEEEVNRARSLGLCGVKIHPDIQGVDINDRRLLPLYEILQAKGLPLYLHMGDSRPEYRFSEAGKLVDVLEQFPSLVVVAAHLGGYTAWDDAMEKLAGRENVWYDTSSALWAMTPERSDEIIHRLGYDKVMFGTDYPIVRTKTELERFFRLHLTDRQREDILWNNAMRFLSFADFPENRGKEQE
ncbi:MAG: amidohydrolase family protein [Eubacteriales bacterium]